MNSPMPESKPVRGECGNSARSSTYGRSLLRTEDCESKWGHRFMMISLNLTLLQPELTNPGSPISLSTKPVKASSISAPSKMFTPTELLVTSLTRACKHPLWLRHCAMQSFCVHQQALWCTQIAGRNFVPKPSCGCWRTTISSEQWDELAPAVIMLRWSLSLLCCKKNVLDRRRWATREELRLEIITWIEATYHRRRRQRRLGRLTPIEFEILDVALEAA